MTVILVILPAQGWGKMTCHLGNLGHFGDFVFLGFFLRGGVILDHLHNCIRVQGRARARDALGY